MKINQFEKELNTLKKFFHIYCNDKHQNQYSKEYVFSYKDKHFKFNISLCQECHFLFNYALSKLKECPHEEKPKCRKCPNPCYESHLYKQMAKIMRYSGMKLGLTKAAKKLKKFFKKN